MKNLELLKKIQPIFTEWNVGDRALYNGRIVYLTADIYNTSRVRVDGMEVKRDDVIHYPYLHQMWEKVDWRLFEKREITGDGKLWIRPVNEKHGWNLDTETALLKALVWQMEQEEK